MSCAHDKLIKIDLPDLAAVRYVCKACTCAVMILNTDIQYSLIPAEQMARIRLDSQP